jgi:hypothetical protein
MSNTPRFCLAWISNFTDIMIIFCASVWESSTNFQLNSTFATPCHAKSSHSCPCLVIKRVSNFYFPPINLSPIYASSYPRSLIFRLASSSQDDGNSANFWSSLFLKSLNVVRFRRNYFTSTNFCLSVCPVALLCVTTRTPLRSFFLMKTIIGVTSIY